MNDKPIDRLNALLMALDNHRDKKNDALRAETLQALEQYQHNVNRRAAGAMLGFLGGAGIGAGAIYGLSRLTRENPAAFAWAPAIPILSTVLGIGAGSMYDNYRGRVAEERPDSDTAIATQRLASLAAKNKIKFA